MANENKTAMVLTILAGCFLALALMFGSGVGDVKPDMPSIQLVDASFLDTTPPRASYADLVSAKEDLSDFDCYACHERNKPPPLKFDDAQNIIVPKEHENIVMGHGTHNRNNNCFNCHNELNLEQLQTRDHREVTFAQSTPLCGSCHGPTYRDWEAGVHGRTSGSWDRSPGKVTRLDCVNCHNPHHPKFPQRKPAPGPNALREQTGASAHPKGGH